MVEVGEILEGKVTGLTNFGAFISLPGNLTGMVHISEVSQSYVCLLYTSHPDKFAPIGLHEDIMSMVGIDANGIIEAVRELMHKDFELDDNWDDERCV